MNIIAMSDLHLSKKPWTVRKAFSMARDADLVLIAGDLINDGTSEQLELMRQCISDVLPDTPVLAVAGNHDYPIFPSPMLGELDYPKFQEWLLKRQTYPYVLDYSGAYAVRVGDIEVIGLNCARHWRRFKFADGAQLRWLENHLNISDAARHIILCHAPTQAHNPKGLGLKPYLSRDEQLQRILDAHRGVIFISGHTHISMERPGCMDLDASNGNLYLNIGSIRPTTALDENGKAEVESKDGNLVRLNVGKDYTCIEPFSIRTGSTIKRSIYGTELGGREIGITF